MPSCHMICTAWVLVSLFSVGQHVWTLPPRPHLIRSTYLVYLQHHDQDGCTTGWRESIAPGARHSPSRTTRQCQAACVYRRGLHCTAPRFALYSSCFRSLHLSSSVSNTQRRGLWKDNLVNLATHTSQYLTVYPSVPRDDRRPSRYHRYFQQKEQRSL